MGSSEVVLIKEHTPQVGAISILRLVLLYKSKIFSKKIILLKGSVNPEIDEKKIWKCEKCRKKYSSASIDKIVMALDDEKNRILQDPERKTVREIENFITKCKKVLDPRNLIIIRMKYNLIGLYGRELGFTTQARNCLNVLSKKKKLELPKLTTVSNLHDLKLIDNFIVYLMSGNDGDPLEQKERTV